ncbi:hypothetical protein H0I23_15115 [Cellulophaga sp. HaHaR_3_176]|uniref:hypothetical protein n=1 Tax=Cellulophaga sp. HaHaR_3_176 TaxID=1942464 RepID=UPI001C1F67E2|nr:hypothetical protein [Cellulophaga sp. HaHaR_3_176]QWX83763.1 hypothetical protein H0I23_15115 [Cellulophaga sp. HaHaR_3_176]
MAEEKFNWKSLFVNDNVNQTEDTKTSAPSKTDFPKEVTSSSTKFPDTPPPLNTKVEASSLDNSILNNVIEMYESGFESLNLPGYDFYEFFKAIKAVGSNDASVYKMAITMAQSVDSKVSKKSLLDGAEFYIKEINNVHESYQSKGSSKREEIQTNQISQKKILSSEISELEKQILTLQTKISEKKNQLNSIDSGLLSETADIEQKIVANNIAKNKILETITVVVDGIKQNL